MRKLFILPFLLFGLTVTAQQQKDNNRSENFNHWSIEGNFGLNKALRPVSSGYYNPTFLDFDDLGDTQLSYSADLGVRYMINNKFGLKVSGSYNEFRQATGSNNFDTDFYYGLIEGVVNGGALLGFRDWTQTLNFLVHAGAGPGWIEPGDNSMNSGASDGVVTFTAGITPQVKISDHWVLNADVSLIGNALQDVSWDGNSDIATRGFNGAMMTTKVGVTYYLGSADKHVDWASDFEMTGKKTRVDSLRSELSDIQDKMKDSDQDGVPDYLDREPNTMNGVAVNSKGVAVDKNQNGVPDEIENSLDDRYQKKGESDDSQGAASGTVKKLLNDGYVNVYFKFNSTQPSPNSMDNVNYLKQYMKNNPDAQAELIGYADEIGNSDYNKRLSKQRAEKVKTILTSSGIDGSRLSVTGNGIDDSVDKSSGDARSLVRRVTFKLK